MHPFGLTTEEGSELLGVPLGKSRCYHDDWAEAVTIGHCSSNTRLITVLVGMFASDSLVFPTILALVRFAISSSSRLASSLLALSPSEVVMGGPLREIGCGRWIVTILDWWWSPSFRHRR